MSDATRDLHDLIDRRIAMALGDAPISVVRGTITEVNAQVRTCAATLDASRQPTQGIAIPAGIMPEVGDDALIARRQDGFLFLLHPLDRDYLVTGSLIPSVDAGVGSLADLSVGSLERKYDAGYIATLYQDWYTEATEWPWYASTRYRRARGTTYESRAVVQDDDFLGGLVFYGYDGEDYRTGAYVLAQVDGTPGDDDMPTCLLFATRSSGDSSESLRVTIDPAGVVELHQGQLKFPATQVPSAGGTTLDDYEEGSFSGTWYFAGGSTGIAYTTTGYYTKVGREVTCHIAVTFTAKGSSTGQFYMSGLPFAAANVTGPGGAHISYLASAASGVVDAYGVVSSNAAYITWYCTTTSPGVSMTDAHLTDTTQIYATVKYRV